ncbi:MAG TPA: hypothetical protein VEU52_09775 [Candidatus Limnocylindrales bacterium]|jgi:hypothetical protein|nr:hypothetical protein [Candidatus Limnocylindrales bacterium]
MKSLVVIVLLGTSAAVQIAIPAGTILPVRLETSINSERSKAGDKIEARIMQDVPLPGRGKIRRGSLVVGQVKEAAPASSGQGGRFTIVFDSIKSGRETIPVRTNLRVIASLLEVDEAQIQEYGGDRGTPTSAFTTTQIGGEMVYRGGGHVMNGRDVVGEPVPYGVLARVREVEDSKCRGAVAGNDSPQALWIFSTDACGVFGYPGMRIVHAGRTEPVGEIVLAEENGNVHLRAGSAMLLRVVGSGR